MRDPVPTITLDTNCAINLFDRRSTTATSVDELSTLMRYALAGRIEISVTTRVEADLLGDRDESRRAEMLRFLDLLPTIGTILRFDTSRWDSGDVFVDDRTERLHQEIQGIVFPGLSPGDRRYRNKVNDIDHLVGHTINCRDIFVTDDREILRKASDLRTAPGIVIMSPSQCVSYVDEMVNRSTPKSFPSTGIDTRYHNPGLEGRVTFNYSNNNGSFAIGEGHFFFETKWSKADDTSIHAYTDAASISALAIAKQALEMKGIRDATVYDYSSRSRTAGIGKIVIWRNINGLYAATKILDEPPRVCRRLVVLSHAAMAA